MGREEEEEEEEVVVVVVVVVVEVEEEEEEGSDEGDTRSMSPLLHRSNSSNLLISFADKEWRKEGTTVKSYVFE